jgi:hypothetical protein
MSEWGRDNPRLAAEEAPAEKSLPPPPPLPGAEIPALRGASSSQQQPWTGPPPPLPGAEIPALRGASSSQQQQPWTGPSSVAHLGAFAAHSPVKKTYSNPGGRDPQNAEQQSEPRGQSLPRNVAPPTRQDHALFSFSQCCGSMTFWCGSGSGSGSADPCL